MEPIETYMNTKMPLREQNVNAIILLHLYRRNNANTDFFEIQPRINIQGEF